MKKCIIRRTKRTTKQMIGYMNDYHHRNGRDPFSLLVSNVLVVFIPDDAEFVEDWEFVHKDGMFSHLRRVMTIRGNNHIFQLPVDINDIISWE